MTEITEIDFDMYLTLKWSDIQKLPIEQRNKLIEIVDDGVMVTMLALSVVFPTEVL